MGGPRKTPAISRDEWDEIQWSDEDYEQLQYDLRRIYENDVMKLPVPPAPRSPYANIPPATAPHTRQIRPGLLPKPDLPTKEDYEKAPHKTTTIDTPFGEITYTDWDLKAIGKKGPSGAISFSPKRTPRTGTPPRTHTRKIRDD